MDRMDEFQKLKSHAWYGPLMKRLSKSEFEICRFFLIKNESKQIDQFCHDVNRMFLGIQNVPKNFTLIMELLTVAAQNSKERK